MSEEELVRRLRAPAYWMSGSSDGHEGENEAPREAADMIHTLKAERDALRALVEAAYREGWHEGYSNGDAGRGYSIEDDWIASDARASVEGVKR